MNLTNFRQSLLCVYIAYQSLWLSQSNTNSQTKYFHHSTVQTFKILILKVSAVTYIESSDTYYFQKIIINSSVVETSRTIGPFRPSRRGESIGQPLSLFNSIKMTKIPLNSSVFSSRQHFSKTNRLNQLISSSKA
jgi:hypothetical protein